jgi:hypothetical protein
VKRGGSQKLKWKKKKKEKNISSVLKLTVAAYQNIFFDFNGRGVQDFHAYLNNP